MTNKAWDEDSISRENYGDCVFSLGNPSGLNEEASELLWPITWEQYSEWGGKAGDEIAWTYDGGSTCTFAINGKLVARGVRSFDGNYTWTRITAEI